MKRTFEARKAARQELGNEGFVVGFSSPGRPHLWLKPKDMKRRYAIAQDRDTEQWLIVDYPEPSSCTPAKVRELAERDGMTKAPADDWLSLN